MNKMDTKSVLIGISETQCHSTKDVDSINREIITIYHNAAESIGDRTNRRNNAARKTTNKATEPWFDDDLWDLRRRINRYSRWLSKHPSNTTFRSKLFALRKDYKKEVKFKKDRYIEIINKEIEDGGQISWENFNNLKRYNKCTQEMDIFDVGTFICFFKRLYGTKPLAGYALNRFKIDNNTHLELESILNKETSETELTSSITKLKSGKAAAEDRISNEFIKNSSVEMQLALLKLFNECLNHEY